MSETSEENDMAAVGQATMCEAGRKGNRGRRQLGFDSATGGFASGYEDKVIL
jgi:hypothetical protein